MTSMLDSALSYAARGWAVLPLHSIASDGRCTCGADCDSPGKHPRIGGGLKKAATDEQTVRSWWGRWPDANIGIRTDGLCVIDIDGPVGESSLEELEQTYCEMPPTYTVSTGKGEHYYFADPERIFRNRAGLVPGIDVRACGGYVVAPPSNHISGRAYAVLFDGWGEQPVPPWLAELIKKPEPKPQAEWTVTNLPSPAAGRTSYAQVALANELAALASSKNGTRNDNLNNAAYNLYQLVKAGELDQTETTDLLAQTASQLGLGTTETERTLASAWKDAEARDMKAAAKRWEDRKERERLETTPPLASPAPTDRPPAPMESPSLTAGSSGAGAAVTAADTFPYAVEQNRMVLKVEKKDYVEHKVIADFQATITTEQRSEENDKTFVLAGTTFAGKPFALTMPAKDFASDVILRGVLTAAAGAKAPVRAGMSRHLAPAIQRLSGEIAYQTTYGRTGWAGDHFLIPGREPEAATITLPRNLPYSASDTPLDLDALNAIIRAKPTPRSTIVLSFVLCGPLAELVGWRNERHGLFIAGRTGALKSSWSQALMTIWGRDFLRDDLLIKWGMGNTPNALMALATHCHDLPMLIDNYKPNTGGGHKDFTNTVHNMIEGGEKNRLNRAAELREAKPVFTWPLMTGEDVPDSDPASLARVLIVPFAESTDDEKQHLTIAQQRTLTAVGWAWLEWLQSDHGRECADKAAALFEECRREWATYLQACRSDMVNTLRVATSLAINEITWLVLCEHPELGPVAQQYSESHSQGLEEVAALMASYTAESLEATRYLAALRELLASGRAELRSIEDQSVSYDRERMIGWQDGETCYLLPQVTRAAIDRLLGPQSLNGMSAKTLYTQLAGLGHIVDCDPGRQTKNKWIAGRSQCVLWLRYTDLFPEEE